MSMEVKTVMQDTPEKFRPLAGEIVPPRCTEKVRKWGVPGSRGNGLVWGPGPTGCSTDRRGCGARSLDRAISSVTMAVSEIREGTEPSTINLAAKARRESWSVEHTI